MLVSDELKQSLDSLKAEIEGLKAENKIEDAYNKISELEQLNNDYINALAEEAKELQNLNLKNESEEINMLKSIELMNKITVEDRQAVENIVRGMQNAVAAGSNGFLIPTSVSATIIAKAEELSNVYVRCRKFNVTGDMVFPKAGTGVTVTYVDEGTAFGESNPTLGSVKIQSFIAGALCKVSKSLINRAGVDILQYVIDELGKGLAKFLDREALVGTTNKATGLMSTTNKVIAATLSSDAFIDCQLSVDDVQNPVWVMNKNTLKSVRKFKGTDGQYILTNSLVDGFKFQILADGVIINENMADGEVLYGDLSAEYVKLAQDVQMQVLTEKYADTFQIGVIGNVEFDAKLVEDYKVAKIVKA